MARNLKHVGQIKNTGRRCVVAFREMYDDKGHVVDENNCLIFETDNLPDAEHQNLMTIVESENAQSTGDLYNVLNRERLGNGMTALQWLAQSNRLRKVATGDVIMTPNANNTIPLDQLNTIVRLKKKGMSDSDIQKALDKGVTQPEAGEPAQPQTAEDGVLDDSALAKSLIQQAETFEKQAAELREQAIGLDPSLAPKKTTRKAAAKKT